MKDSAPDSDNHQDARSGEEGLWIQAARDGSSEALGKIAERCHGYLLRIANHELGLDLSAKVGASDLVQETLYDAHRGFHQFQGTTSEELRGWLKAILIRKILSVARIYRDSDKRRIDLERPLDALESGQKQAFELLDPQHTPRRLAVNQEAAAILNQAIAALPPQMREVIVLRSLEERPWAEIAVAMDRSVEAARKLYSRAILQLSHFQALCDDAEPSS